MPGALKAFEFRHRSESDDQSSAQQPSRRAFDAVVTAPHLGLGGGSGSTAIGKRRVQRRDVDPRTTCMPVNYGEVFEVLAQNKVRLKELFVELVERKRLMSASPLCGSQRWPCIGKV